MITRLLARFRAWQARRDGLRLCARGDHDERRLRKSELPEVEIAAANLKFYRICDRCGNLRAVRTRRAKMKVSE